MKKIIRLTESELNRIIKNTINELNSRSEEYLNQLLDKINSSGMDSLDPKEMDALNRMSRDEDIEDLTPRKVLTDTEDYGEIKFYIDNDGEIEEIEGVENTPFDLDDVAEFLQRLIFERKLKIGHRTEGTITFTEDEIEVDYKLFNALNHAADDDFNEFTLALNRSDYGF